MLSNTEIQQMMEIGAVYCDPFSPKVLNNTSVDLTLGEEIARYKHSGEPVDLAEEDPALMFDVEGAELHGGKQKFYLKAGERVLACTREMVGGRCVPCPECKGKGSKDVAQGPHRRPLSVTCALCEGDKRIAVTSQVHATSTAGRIGLQAVGCAGFGDIGFFSRWVLEVTNMSPRPLWLPVGGVICQVSFFRVKPQLDGSSYEQIGSYQKTADVDVIRSEWKLANNLPKRLKVR